MMTATSFGKREKPTADYQIQGDHQVLVSIGGSGFPNNHALLYFRDPEALDQIGWTFHRAAIALREKQSESKKTGRRRRRHGQAR